MMTVDRTISAAVGRRIRGQRVMSGLTQEQLSERIGCSWQQLQKYEVGHDRISVDRLGQIAAGLGTRISDLLDPTPVSVSRARWLSMSSMVEGFPPRTLDAIESIVEAIAAVIARTGTPPPDSPTESTPAGRSAPG